MSGRNATHAACGARGGEGENHLPVRLAQVGVRRGGVEAEDLARRLAQRRARLHLELAVDGRVVSHLIVMASSVFWARAGKGAAASSLPDAACSPAAAPARRPDPRGDYSDGAAARSGASPPSSRRRRRPTRRGRAPPSRRRPSRSRRATRGTRRAARGRAGAWAWLGAARKRGRSDEANIRRRSWPLFFTSGLPFFGPAASGLSMQMGRRWSERPRG